MMFTFDSETSDPSQGDLDFGSAIAAGIDEFVRNNKEALQRRLREEAPAAPAEVRVHSKKAK